MRILIVLPVLLLQGCWFFMFPIPAGFGPGNACVPEDHVVGRRLKNETGKIGTITALHGRHSRCQVGTHPILADVEYDE